MVMEQAVTHEAHSHYVVNAFLKYNFCMDVGLGFMDDAGRQLPSMFMIWAGCAFKA